MVKLISIDDWIASKFVAGSGPSSISVRRWCRDGEIPAQKVGGKWYIEIRDTVTDELIRQVLQEAV